MVGFVAQLTFAQHSIEFKKWMYTNPQKLNMPAFADVKNIDGDTFEASNLLTTTNIDFNCKTLSWNIKEITEDSILINPSEKNQLIILKSYLSVDRWTKGSMNITLNGLYELYVDNKLVKTQKSASLKSSKQEIKIDRGNHEIIIKLITTENTTKIKASFEYEEEFANCNANASLNSEKLFTIHDVMEGNFVSSASISPSGKYVLINYAEVVNGSGKTKRYSELYNLENKKNVSIFRNKDISNVSWLPRTDRLTYSMEFEGAAEIFVYDVETGIEKSVAN